MMRNLIALLYTGFLFGANPVLAGPVDPALLTGDMEKLILQDGVALPGAKLTDLAGAEHDLARYRGKWLVVNFWATWCVPCRTEMPSLDRLQMAQPDITVMAVATGPNPQPAIERFLDEAAVQSLTVLRDPDQLLAHQMGVFGLPVTVIVNPDGVEVGRLIGGAEWDSDAALKIMTALTAP